MRKVVHGLGKALRETGQAIDRVGLTVSGDEIFKENFSKHRSVMNLFDKVVLKQFLNLMRFSFLTYFISVS